MNHAIHGVLVGLALLAFSAMGCSKDEEQNCDGGTPATADAACEIQVGTQCFQDFGSACECAGCPGKACAQEDGVPSSITCK
jgi:hypothetical protein